MKAKDNYLNFTKRMIENLPKAALGKRSYYRDTKLKGLELIVTDKGVMSFAVYRKVNGRPIRVRLGRFPDLSVENARKKGAEVITELNSGKNPNIEKKKLRAEMTLGELYEAYMQRYSKKQKKSWQYDEREIPKFLGHWFSRRLSDISKPEIQTMHFRVHDENGLYQANRALERLRAMYNKAIEWGWEGSNPALGIKKFREKSRERFVQADEMGCLFQAIEEEENVTARDYFMIAILTGARKTNTLQMRWEQVNMERAEWRIPETKNGDPVTLPLATRALEILERRRKMVGRCPWVFPGEGKEGHYLDPKKAWRRVCHAATLKLWQKDEELAALVQKIRKNLKPEHSVFELVKAVTKEAETQAITMPTGLMDVRLHDLRRTLGSWQAATGASTLIIGKSLGHRSQQSTAIYSRLNLDPVRASVEVATEAMFAAAGGK